MEATQNKVTIADFIFFVMITLFLVVGEHPVWSLVANGLALAFCLFSLMERGDSFKLYNTIILYGIFCFLCFLSYFYSRNPAQSLVRLRSIWLLLFLLAAGINYFSRENGPQKFMLLYIGAALLSCVYLAMSEDLFSNEIIAESINNSNVVGTKFAFAAIFSLFFFLQKKQWWTGLLFAVFIVFILLTASRSAVTITVIATVALILSNYRQRGRSPVLAVVLAVVFVTVLGFLIFRIDFFYQLIGARLEDAFSLFSEGKGDHSSEKRIQLIRYGWQLFGQHPIFGQGVNTFSSSDVKSMLGFQAYSHNTYIELLVGVGLVGTVSYYLLPVTLLVRSFRVLRNKTAGTDLSVLAFSVVIGMLVSDFFTVNYYSKAMLLMYMFAGATCVKYSEEGEETSESIGNRSQRLCR